MEWNDVYSAMEKFEAAGIDYLEVEINGDHLKMKKNSQSDFSTVANHAVNDISEPIKIKPNQISSAPQIKAPMVGVFYAAAAPEQDSFVKVGSVVKKGDTVCLLEAMKMMNEVKAPEDGVIKKIMVQDGDMVEYGQPLFEL